MGNSEELDAVAEEFHDLVNDEAIAHTIALAGIRRIRSELLEKMRDSDSEQELLFGAGVRRG